MKILKDSQYTLDIIFGGVHHFFDSGLIINKLKIIKSLSKILELII